MNNSDNPVEVNTMVLVSLTEHGATITVNQGKMFMMQRLKWNDEQNIESTEEDFATKLKEATNPKYADAVSGMLFYMERLMKVAKNMAKIEKAGEMVKPL